MVIFLPAADILTNNLPIIQWVAIRLQIVSTGALLGITDQHTTHTKYDVKLSVSSIENAQCVDGVQRRLDVYCMSKNLRLGDWERDGLSILTCGKPIMNDGK